MLTTFITCLTFINVLNLSVAPIFIRFKLWYSLSFDEEPFHIKNLTIGFVFALSCFPHLEAILGIIPVTTQCMFKVGGDTRLRDLLVALRGLDTQLTLLLYYS